MNKYFYIFIVIFFIIFLLLSFKAKKRVKIPKVIWSYWEGDVPIIVKECIETWKKHNPDYTINFLNKEGVKTFLPDFNDNIKHVTQPARYSDYVRLNLLKKYGGSWLDASIICNTSLKWLQDIQKKENVEFIGYRLNGFEDEKINIPVIESWFLACIPNSKFINDWCDEFMRTNDFDNIDAYLDNVKSSGTSFQKIWNPNYLTIHISAQHILRKNKNKYKLHLISAEESAYKWLFENDWNVEKSVEQLFTGKYNNQYIIKIRSCDRTEIDREKLDISNMLLNNKEYVFVINLDRNIDRLKKIKDIYEKTDLNIFPLERIQAVDGKNMKLEDLKSKTSEKVYDGIVEIDKTGKRKNNSILTRGMIGCYLSHIELYKKNVDKDRIIVLEDDAKFNDNNIYKNIIKKINKLVPYDWDIVLLGYLHNPEYKCEQKDTYDIVNGNFWGTQGYMISNKGMKKMLKYADIPIETQIDYKMGDLAIEGKLNIYTLKKQYISQEGEYSEVQMNVSS